MALDFLRVVILLTHNKNPKGLTPSDLYDLAEKVGFEPTHRYTQSTPLAGEPLTATWVLLHAMLCCYWMSGDVDPSVSAK